MGWDGIYNYYSEQCLKVFCIMIYHSIAFYILNLCVQRGETDGTDRERVSVQHPQVGYPLDMTFTLCELENLPCSMGKNRPTKWTMASIGPWLTNYQRVSHCSPYSSGSWDDNFMSTGSTGAFVVEETAVLWSPNIPNLLVKSQVIQSSIPIPPCLFGLSGCT